MRGGWFWNGMFVACSIGLDLYSSQHQEGLHLHMHGCQGQLCPFSFRATPTYGVVSYS